ncbi:hypothetical protein [Anaerotignum sp.]
MEGIAYMLHPQWLSWILPILAVITLVFLAQVIDAHRKKDNQKKKLFGILLLISILLLAGWCIRLLLWLQELQQMVPPHF